MNGILLVDKPAGWTSHDVVAKVRALLRQQVYSGQFSVGSETKISLKPKDFKLKTPKVGHTGTLDPFATGLLVLVVGSYTKRAGEFSKLDKTYEAELTLGATSTTGDIEGEIIPKLVRSDKKWEKIMRSHNFLTKITEVLRSFEGEIWQKPHQYSAVKIGGQRAYKLARQGKTPQLRPRKVTIYSLELLDYSYPKLKIRTKVSSGTYIRSLAEDIGKELGTGAYLSSLRRTSVGDFKVDNAQNLQNISNLL